MMAEGATIGGRLVIGRVSVTPRKSKLDCRGVICIFYCAVVMFFLFDYLKGRQEILSAPTPYMEEKVVRA